ncbi:hypothetical protein N7495_000033 [Penicillium taxi]|uniref:uncharacterized protein n=1 Tax=Penicillium taxi TaxID=168475 RepID=UPI002544E0E9|nr:uncharacterized protein N7495_000033 [Penicillium taxi]KAJ5907351.1 hypothetical protein N7495_000033 [Penicillium taxi]
MAQIQPLGPRRSTSAHPLESKLSHQLQPESLFPQSDTVTRSPKSRSLSDASRPTPTPQPSTGDLSRPQSKDDTALPSLPATPSRSNTHHNLSLNLPSKTASPSISRAPLSPQLDSSQIYGSPGSVLPRRSRGLDFSRACTNLHHSTLAESSPNSSPTIGGRGISIPQRRGSLGLTSAPPFSTSGPADRTVISGSMSSVNMMEEDTSSSSEGEDDSMMGDGDDIMLSTPQAARMSGPGPFATGYIQSPGNEWMGGYSQAAASLMSFQRARLSRKGRSRHSSSSASGNSSKPSPGPHSPPVMKSVENAGGYFASRQTVHSRRESLSLGTRDLRLSDLSDDGEARAVRPGSPTGGPPLGVIRRAVTRRGSLLVSRRHHNFSGLTNAVEKPKTKTFARIRAELMEEGAPIDSDMKREAEVVRQVRDTETEASPTLRAIPSLHSPQDMDSPQPSAAKAIPTTNSFSKQASRNSGGVGFWNSFDERYRTPPPMRQTGGSSVPDDDVLMDMTPSSMVGPHATDLKQRSRSSTPHAPVAIVGELRRKRRRDDDFDPNTFKRRAVSPSMSVQSSPVLTHSSTVDNGPNIWGPSSKLGPPFSERPAGTPKRIGLQGMTEANDGFMNMSIE